MGVIIMKMFDLLLFVVVKIARSIREAKINFLTMKVQTITFDGERPLTPKSYDV